MNVDVRDIHKILEYRAATAIVRLLPTGLLLIFCSLAILVFVDPDRESIWTFVGVGLCFVFGIGVIAFSLWTRADAGKPLFTLTPAGIRYRITGVKEVFIPWREIRGVETVDVETGYWSMLWSIHVLRYNEVTFHDVTVVLVTKSFYESRIYLKSLFLRGPGWNGSFIPQGDLVQVALHHELVSTTPQDIRDAVEARWLAFRDKAEPVRTSVPRLTASGANMDGAPKSATPQSDVIAMGESPKSMPTWEAVKIGLLLAGIVAAAANLAGLWDLPGQAKEREERAERREQQRKWEESNRRMKEDSKRLEAEREKMRQSIDDAWRRFDRDRPIR